MRAGSIGFPITDLMRGGSRLNLLTNMSLSSSRLPLSLEFEQPSHAYQCARERTCGPLIQVSTQQRTPLVCKTVVVNVREQHDDSLRPCDAREGLTRGCRARDRWLEPRGTRVDRYVVIALIHSDDVVVVWLWFEAKKLWN